VLGATGRVPPALIPPNPLEAHCQPDSKQLAELEEVLQAGVTYEESWQYI
jgi:hypothetical protein